ncbi:hypothetical protein HAZT_HAZT000347 [Hyalella azteca]|uniref:Peptidase M14 domain-containing protein n=1 Tax=Hyalella azteca TaxID=294128 RepID=A0A6A0GUK9_HYAAZ|nr:hypothetical protein HAZT_HAZT000347 [Hyalella azteca]
MLGELAQLEADFPNLVSSYEIGTTYEGRTLKVIAVSSGQVANAPVIWLDCGIHAREWVSHATCMYVLDQLTSGYGSDDVVNALLAAYDFHVLPITNPDGYVHSWDADRLWRKNRVPYGACFGADVNRNFDSNFGGEGASDLACADTYHGPSAFSEVESAAIRDSLIALGSRVKAVFTLHSYSQYWMFPYGYTTDRPADYDELVYVASGGSVDYTYETLGITYSFAVELRDQGQYGFLLPADQIIPTAEEFFAGFYTAIQNFQ